MSFILPVINVFHWELLLVADKLIEKTGISQISDSTGTKIDQQVSSVSNYTKSVIIEFRNIIGF